MCSPLQVSSHHHLSPSLPFSTSLSTTFPLVITILLSVIWGFGFWGLFFFLIPSHFSPSPPTPLPFEHYLITTHLLSYKIQTLWHHWKSTVTWSLPPFISKFWRGKMSPHSKFSQERIFAKHRTAISPTFTQPACHPSSPSQRAVHGEQDFQSSIESICHWVLCFFAWAQKSNLSGLQNYGAHLDTKPKAICSTKHLLIQKEIPVQKVASICYLSFFLFLKFFRILVAEKIGIYWTFPKDHNTSSHFIEGLHLPNTVVMSAYPVLCHFVITTLHLPPSILTPFGFVHGSFIHVPWWLF